jgi:hypothetical protein
MAALLKSNPCPGIVKDHTILDRSLPIVIDPYAVPSVVVDLATPKYRGTFLTDLNAGILVGEDVTLLHNPLAPFIEGDPYPPAIVDAAASEDRVCNRAVNGDTGKGIRSDIAILNERPALDDLQSVILVPLQADLTSNRQSTQEGVFSLHEHTTCLRALDDDLFSWPIADELQGPIEDEAFTIETWAHEDARARLGISHRRVEGFQMPWLLLGDNQCRNGKDFHTFLLPWLLPRLARVSREMHLQAILHGGAA